MNTPTHLGIEHLGASVLGLGERRPRLSWQLPPGATRQEAYALELDGTVLDRVPSDACVLVPWPATALSSRQRVAWRVKVWADGGESDWSALAWFETGLLDPGDWSARWVEPSEAARSAHVLRHTFRLDAVAGMARLYATAHGVYETFLNGRRVGDIELAPGYTSYPTTLHVQVYDVGALLVPGDNTWEVVLSDGWWRGRTGFFQGMDGFGSTLGFLGQLEAGEVVVGTGAEWQSATGSLRSADLMAGQVEDHRARPNSWLPVTVVDADLGSLAYSPAPPTRRVEELRPVGVTRPAPDRQVVDLGQNINGWLRLSDLGPEGTELTIVHGEFLDPSGDVTQDHLTPDFFGDDMQVGMIDRVVAAGTPGEGFEPRQTTHGFQYARIEGHPGRLTPDDVTGVVVHTDFRRTGWFRCSDDRLNRLHDITEWSFRDNACEIPTDCPQRERAGWTGDWQLFIPTGAFLYDVAGFSLKWLRDVAAEQLDDGRIINYSPDPLRQHVEHAGRWLSLQGSSGWGDAIVMVPWEMWRAYGDEEALAEFWPSMVAWVDFAATAARLHRHESRSTARPEPAPHEQFIWDGTYHWGEWLEPGSLADDHDHVQLDHGSVGTAFLQHSAALAARIGRMLGHDAEAARFDELAANVLAAWRTEFIGPDGALAPDSQANHVRALAFGLVPDELRPQTAARLVSLIGEAGTHLGTGFLATPYLLPMLADTGHLSVAYELLLQDTPPSWLAMVERGATTVWEAWEGIDDEGRPHDSLNHYSKGAVISFLHNYVAGITLLDGHPAYRRFRVAPRPGGGLTWAEGVHDSPYGRIESAWHIEGTTFRLTVTAPPGTVAEVALPDGSCRDQGPSTVTYECGLA